MKEKERKGERGIEEGNEGKRKQKGETKKEK